MTILVVGMFCLVIFCVVAALLAIAIRMVDRRTIKTWREWAWVCVITAVVMWCVWCIKNPPADLARYM